MNARCESPRGTAYHPAKRVACEVGCGKWKCAACGPRKARRVAAKFAKLGADYMITLTVRPGFGWPTPQNYAHLQKSWRWFSRWMQRHNLVAGYAWVTEVSDAKPDCTCEPPQATRGPQDSLFGRDCFCGAGGNRLHRHMMVRLATAANRYGRKWLPYDAMQAAAARCGLGAIDCQPLHSARDVARATRYVAKYLAKGVAGAAHPWVRRYAMNVRIELAKEAGWLFSTMRLAWVAREYLGAGAVDSDATYWSPNSPPGIAEPVSALAPS